MLVHGDWQYSEAGLIHEMKLGEVYYAHIWQHPGNGVDVRWWVGVLNGKQVVERSDLDYVKGYIERFIVDQVQFIAPAYRLVKNRALIFG